MLLVAAAGARSNESAANFILGTGICPTWLRSGVAAQDFSVIAWVKPTTMSSQSICGMKHCFSLRFNTGFVSGRVCQTGGASAAAADVGISLSTGVWNLVCMSWNSTTKRVDTFVYNAANPTGATANATAGAVTYQAPEDMRIGSQGQGDSADFNGYLGCVAILGRQTSAADLQAIYNSKSYQAPWRYPIDTYALTNYVALNCSLPSTLADEAGAGAGWLLDGENVGVSNTAMSSGWPYVDSSRTAGTNMQTHRPNWTHQSGTPMVWKTHEAEAFFLPPAIAGAAPVGSITGESSAAKRLAAGTAANDVTIAVSNSRAVRRPAAGGKTRPENHMHGYIEAKKSIVKGFLNGRPNISASSEAITWFGLAVALSETVENSGTIRTINTTAGWVDFTRMWTGGDQSSASSPASSQGQGYALDSGGAKLGLKVTPESGSLMTSTRGLHVRYHIARFPGCQATLDWKPVKSASQAAGTDVAGTTTLTGLNTSVAGYIYAGGDSYNSGTKTIVLASNLVAAGVQAGHVMVNGTTVSAAEIASISFGGGNATIVLKTALAQSPNSGDRLWFGPWGTTTIEYRFDAIAGGDTQVNRGLVLTAPPAFSNGTLGPILLGIDAWARDTVGHVIGNAGYSGNGYQNQLDDAWTGMHNNFYTKVMSVPNASSYSLFMHHADQQVALPGLVAYAAVVKVAVPSCSIVYCGDPTYGTNSDIINWDTVTMGQSARLACTILADTRFGDIYEQVARGYRADIAHPSALGHLRIAQANLDRFASSALPTPDLAAVQGGHGGLRRMLTALSVLDPGSIYGR